MALAVNDETLRRVYSALTTAHFYEATVWGSLGSRNYEADLQTAYNVLIQTESFNTTVAGRTRAQLHSSFVAGTEPGTTSEEMAMDQAVETTQEIPMLDRVEGILGGSLFDRAAREAGIKMANHVDDYFGGLITGADFGTNKSTIGSDTNFINHITGKASTDAAGEALVDAAGDLVLWARRANLLEGIQLGGPSLSDLYIVMPPELARVMSKVLREQGHGNLGEIRELNRVGILRYDTVMIGRVEGVDLYASVKLPKPANANANWKMYGGVRQGVEFAARPMMTRRVTAQTRESGGWRDTMGSMMQYAGKVVNEGLLYEFTVDSGKT